MITEMIVEPTHTDDIQADLKTVQNIVSIPDSVEIYPTPSGNVLLVNVHDSNDPEAYLIDRLDRVGFLAIVWDRKEFDAD